MRSIMLMVLLPWTAPVLVTALPANYNSKIQDYVSKVVASLVEALVGKAVDQAFKALPIHHVDIATATLANSGLLDTRSSQRERPSCSTSRSLFRVLSAPSSVARSSVPFLVRCGKRTDAPQPSRNLGNREREKLNLLERLLADVEHAVGCAEECAYYSESDSPRETGPPPERQGSSFWVNPYPSEDEATALRKAVERLRRRLHEQQAKMAYDVYKSGVQPAVEQLDTLCGNGEQCTVTGRAKRPESAANRLQRAVERGWTTNELLSVDAMDQIWDAIGVRAVLREASPDHVNAFVDDLVASQRAGRLEIVRANSLYGRDGIPYFTQHHLDMIREAGKERGRNIVTQMKVYDSGFTAVCIYVKYSLDPNDKQTNQTAMGEIQVMGTLVPQLAAAEHLVYDAILDKPVQDAFPSSIRAKALELVNPIRQAARSMDEMQSKLYNKYMSQEYTVLRARETKDKEEVFWAKAKASALSDRLRAIGVNMTVLDVKHLQEVENTIEGMMCCAEQ